MTQKERMLAGQLYLVDEELAAEMRHTVGVLRQFNSEPEPEVRAIWSRTQPVQYTPTTIVTLPALEQELASIRKQGYALDREEHEAGVCCAAVAIRDDHGSPVAAVSISAPPERLTENLLHSALPRLGAIAGQISALLGAVDTGT